MVPGLTSTGVSLALTLALGLTPWGARIAEAVARPLGGGWFWQATLGGLVLLLIVRVAILPFGAWSESMRRENGLSTRTWPSWLVDVAKSFGVSALLSLVALTALIALARRWPDWWWVAGGLGAALLVVTVSFVYPLLIEPVFNKFTPMADGELRSSLLDLAERGRRRGRRRAGGGREPAHVDAERLRLGVRQHPADRGLRHPARPGTGRPRSRRSSPTSSGHVSDRDVVVRDGARGPGGRRRGGPALPGRRVAAARPVAGDLRRSATAAPIAFLLAFVAVVSFVTTPVQSAVSRQIEARADVHALDLTQDPQTFAEMQRRLAVTAKSDVTPNRVLYRWFGTHPTAAARLATARAWALVHPGVQVPKPLVVDPDEAG